MNCLNCGTFLEGSETTCPSCNINVKSFGTFKREAVNPVISNSSITDFQLKNTCPNCREEIIEIESEKCPSCNFKLDFSNDQSGQIYGKFSENKKKDSNNHIKYFGIN